MRCIVRPKLCTQEASKPMMIPAAMDIPPSLAERADMPNDVGRKLGTKERMGCGDVAVQRLVQRLVAATRTLADPRGGQGWWVTA